MDVNPFDNFPSPSQWGLADLLMNWKREHELAITNSIVISNHVDLFPNPPPVIFDQTYQLTKEGSVWIQEVSKWHKTLTDMVDPK